MNKNLKNLLPIIPALLIYGWFAYDLNFIQDDAYITYRYVANYLNGHGLVYNIGEQIEGFTNFGWTIFLIMGGALGLGVIWLSKITGFLCGLGILVLNWKISEKVFSERWSLAGYLAVYLVSINISLAYWAPAGLETAAFALMAMLSFYFFLNRSWLLIWSLALAVWIRPEGAVVTGILIVLEAIIHRRLPLYTLRCGLIALLASLPFVAFKVGYYGSVFPNPFYAKTGLHLDQFSNGLEYSVRFFVDYGLFGAGVVISSVLLLLGRLSKSAQAVLLFFLFYALYIFFIGGDVLKVHRFYLPVFGLSAILIALPLHHLSELIERKTAMLMMVIAGLLLMPYTYYTPRDTVLNFNMREQRFTAKMAKIAEKMLETDKSNFSVALPTIGIFGYTLLGHEVIDMVGLTDSTIARHSEQPISGMETTWKEQKHNTAYLLTRAPDYISFSTGIKPSAPAERALFLYRGFVESYRTVGWYFKIVETDANGLVFAVFKKLRQPAGNFVPYYPVEYVQLYKKGLDNYSRGQYSEAIKYFDRAIRISNKPYNPYLVYNKAFCHMMISDHPIAQPLMDAVLMQDSTIFEAHRDLFLYARLANNEAKAEVHRQWLHKLVPWYLPQVEIYVDQQVKAFRERSK